MQESLNKKCPKCKHELSYPFLKHTRVKGEDFYEPDYDNALCKNCYSWYLKDNLKF